MSNPRQPTVTERLARACADEPPAQHLTILCSPLATSTVVFAQELGPGFNEALNKTVAAMGTMRKTVVPKIRTAVFAARETRYPIFKEEFLTEGRTNWTGEDPMARSQL